MAEDQPDSKVVQRLRGLLQERSASEDEEVEDLLPNQYKLGSTGFTVGLESNGSALNASGSLEDILRLDPQAKGKVPEAISLPESESCYSASDEASARDSDNEVGRSLYALQGFDAPLIPSAVRLPSSENLSMARQPKRKEKKKKKAPQPFSYRKVIQNAGKALDHIANGNLQAVSRHDRVSIFYYDYLRDESVYSQSIEDARELPSLGDRTDIRQRLILVEDLSERTIEVLGRRFGINPEFFEEHLLNSGYSGAKFDQPLSKAWRTASLPKSYVCMKWFRPVWKTPTYFSNRDMPDLLRDKTEHFTHRGKFTTRAETNIFRLEWDLWTDPAKTIRVSRECGWEEKVSIWKGSLSDQDCEIVIVLLDPLPQISEQRGLIKKESHHQAEGSQETSLLLPNPGDDGDIEEARASIFGTSEDGLPRRMNERSTFSDRWLRFLMRQSKGKHVEHDPIHRCIIEQMAPRKEMEVNLDQIFRNEEPTMDFLASLNRTKSTRDELCDVLEPGVGHISLTSPLLQIICRDMFTLLKQLSRTLDEIDIEIIDDARMEDRLILWRQIISRAQRELPEFTASIQPLVAFVANIDPSGAYEEGSQDASNEILNLKTLLKEIQQMVERLRVTSVSLTSNMALLDSRRSIAEAHAVTRLTELAFIFIPLSFAATVFGMQIEPFSNPVPASYFFVVAVAATSFSYIMRLLMRSQWLTQVKTDMKVSIRKYAEKNGISIKPRSLSVGLTVQWMVSTFFANSLKYGVRAVRITLIAAQWLHWRLGLLVSLFLLTGVIIAIPTGILGTRNLSSGLKTAVSLGILLAILVPLGVVFGLKYGSNMDDLWPRIFNRGHAIPGDHSPTRGSSSSPSILRTPRWLTKSLLWIISLLTMIVIPMALLWTHTLPINIKVGATLGISVVPLSALLIYVKLKFWHRATYFSRSTPPSQASDLGT